MKAIATLLVSIGLCLVALEAVVSWKYADDFWMWLTFNDWRILVLGLGAGLVAFPPASSSRGQSLEQ
jgi:hypothetical protein